MNDYLNDLYPQTAPADESLQKTAQLELFAKLAASHDVDLSTMPPEEISSLWNEVMNKNASEEEEDEDKDEDKPKGKGSLPPAFLKNKKGGDDEEKAAAALEQKALEEHADKLASQQKLAEAQQIGEVIAHSFVAKVAEISPEKLASLVDKAPAATEEAPAAEAEAATEEPAKVASSVEGASALDLVAAKNAVKLAEAGGFDPQLVAQHLNARLVLGAPESEKVAHIEDPGQALQARSLELLESIGLPVEWEQA